MEIRPGMHVARSSTTDWESDPEVPGSTMHELVHDGPIWAGMTRIDETPEPMTWTPQQREVFIVLEGSVRVEFADGGDVTVGVGDIATIPSGMTTTWHVTAPFKEAWVLVDA